MQSLYDSLQAEFCPPLDTSLLAALIADVSPSEPDQVDALRTTLKELATQATAQYEHELADELESAHLSSQCITTDESSSCLDFCAEMTGSSAASDSSAISRQSFSSPLGFLQAALPHIPPSRLKRALSQAGTDVEGDVDMESVVETLLTNEFIRELEERGLDGLDDDEPRSPHTPDDNLWKRVETKKKFSAKAAKKKNIRGKTIPFIDTRQKQHFPPPLPTGPPAPDPWTQLSSLSEHLATLLPSHPASFFQSYFHSPNYASPAAAIRAALSSIAGTQNKSLTDTTALFAMLDVLRDSPAYASLDPEQRSTLYSDTQLALRATHGRGDDAIDIVWLLLELNLDLETGTLAMGVYHAPQSPLSPSRSSAWISPCSPTFASRARSGSASGQLPSGPPPVQPPPTSKRKSISVSSGISPTMDKSSPFQWQTRLRSATAGKLRGTGNGFGKGGKGDVGELMHPDLKRRMAASLQKRNELLREASKAWNRGNAKTHGGEVALCFAERAREFQELARREALNEARIMVEAKRAAATDSHTIDLHGTSISEAVVIAKEILEREGCSPANPLRIITGRGTHSANGVGVLKPAVRNALVRGGWNVGMWDGGLVVRGGKHESNWSFQELEMPANTYASTRKKTTTKATIEGQSMQTMDAKKKEGRHDDNAVILTNLPPPQPWSTGSSSSDSESDSDWTAVGLVVGTPLAVGAGNLALVASFEFGPTTVPERVRRTLGIGRGMVDPEAPPDGKALGLAKSDARMTRGGRPAESANAFGER
ncbi:hypothetical protein L210DRAFT_3500779 [Boletus edulis BED1]|uniref:Smr domain-containing protein n=1 Tax=Boletus edulis BED1 TaxID=1328754 RepID=A0AAD4C595_BOLED|nr:hypothetical protein L210DRAFT_3500779 [Boletus edulis BED1]